MDQRAVKELIAHGRKQKTSCNRHGCVGASTGAQLRKKEGES